MRSLPKPTALMVSGWFVFCSQICMKESLYTFYSKCISNSMLLISYTKSALDRFSPDLRVGWGTWLRVCTRAQEDLTNTVHLTDSVHLTNIVRTCSGGHDQLPIRTRHTWRLPWLSALFSTEVRKLLFCCHCRNFDMMTIMLMTVRYEEGGMPDFSQYYNSSQDDASC